MIQLKKDEIQLKIKEEAEQREIVECIKQKLPDLKKLYKEDKIPIYVIGKVLKNKEMDEISKIVRHVLDVEIKFESPKSLGLHGIKKAFNREIASSDTKFQKGSLRSGQKIEYEGSIVILGDVNGGAEVVAGENIVILGSLRGLAHAGAKGNKKGMIAANNIECPQIRIANIIKEIEKTEEGITQIHNYAYVNENDEIVLE